MNNTAEATLGNTAKRAVILHGTSAEPMSGWHPWLKRKLESRGFEVWITDLPGNDRPDKQKYCDYLFQSGWNFEDSVLIGHSSGAVTILNMLMDDRCPPLRMSVLVSAWNGKLINETFDMSNSMQNLFPWEGFDFESIKSKCKEVVLIHNRNDPYCDKQDAQYLLSKLGSNLVMLDYATGGNTDHLGSPLTELPELWDVIRIRINL